MFRSWNRDLPAASTVVVMHLDLDDPLPVRWSSWRASFGVVDPCFRRFDFDQWSRVKIVTSEGEGASASSISFGGNFDLMPKAAKRYGGSAPKDMAGA